MASDEHLRLANHIKSVHQRLRHQAKTIGAERAWNEHLTEQQMLNEYATSMKSLAEKWDNNFQQNNDCQQNDRMRWCERLSLEYYYRDSILEHQRTKELATLKLMQIDCEMFNDLKKLTQSRTKLKLLDVGSCYNPFSKSGEFDVTAIDIAPATEDVFKCDFLNIPIRDTFNLNGSNIVESLPVAHYHVIVFSLLLEYLPSSTQRKLCCKKAYDLLRNEGILLIITPDSKHVGSNAKLMKNWRYTLALMGFSRFRFEKLQHITCMAFRKSLNKSVTQRWADIHRESYMTDDIHIPQDFNDDDKDDKDDKDDVLNVKNDVKGNEGNESSSDNNWRSKDTFRLLQELPQF